MNILTITTVQSPLHWEDPARNLAMFADTLGTITGKTDLVVLPEMFTTGFTMNASGMAEEPDGRTFKWMQEQARSLDAIVTGSYIVKDEAYFYNRQVWMRPDGQFEYYDKRHLFTLAGEHLVYKAGEKKRIIDWKGWKFCPMICYDLRFPVWSRNTDGYDLLLYVANWPETRRNHWRQLLVARAIENQSYVVGVNRVGSDASGHNYSGDSAVVDFSGKVLYEESGKADVFTLQLNRRAMLDFREKLRFLPDQDKFEIFI